MALIKTVSPDNAEGKVKEAYSYFNNLAGMIPLPIQMLSASPELLTSQIGVVDYFVNRSGLSFSLLAHIRLLVAHEENYPYCIDLNTHVLKKFIDLTDEQIVATISDPLQAGLEANEAALLRFVLKVVRDPASTEEKDIDTLHDMGFSDKNIFDAVQEGMMMIVRGMTFKAFKMGETAE